MLTTCNCGHGQFPLEYQLLPLEDQLAGGQLKAGNAQLLRDDGRLQILRGQAGTWRSVLSVSYVRVADQILYQL